MKDKMKAFYLPLFKEQNFLLHIIARPYKLDTQGGPVLGAESSVQLLNTLAISVSKVCMPTIEMIELLDHTNEQGESILFTESFALAIDPVPLSTLVDRWFSSGEWTDPNGNRVSKKEALKWVEKEDLDALNA
jgi:hypothetical protein